MSCALVLGAPRPLSRCGAMTDLGQAKSSHSDHHGCMKQAETDPSIVQQLMFYRILSFVQSLSCEQVIVAGYDVRAGILEASLAGVNFVVNVSLQERR